MITIDSVWSCILALLASVGGIGVVVCAIVKFCSDTITEKLSKSYQLKMDKELEKYKQNLENKKYVTQTQYDVEFSVYRNLTKALFTVCVDAETITIDYSEEFELPEKDKKELEEGKFKKLLESVAEFQNILFQNAPFIKQDIFLVYENIHTDLVKLTEDYRNNLWRYLYKNERDKYLVNETSREVIEQLHSKITNANNQVREYLFGLKIVN